MGSEGDQSANEQRASGNFSPTLHIICKELDSDQGKSTQHPFALRDIFWNPTNLKYICILFGVLK